MVKNNSKSSNFIIVNDNFLKKVFRPFLAQYIKDQTFFRPRTFRPLTIELNQFKVPLGHGVNFSYVICFFIHLKCPAPN